VSTDGSSVDLRRDGAAAVEWVARYLEGMRDLPVRAQVEPGAVRAALPAAPPEHALQQVLDRLEAIERKLS